jgi:hypothetical protein
MTRILATCGLAALLSMTATAAAASASGPCAEFELLGTDGEFTYNPFRPVAIERPLVLRVTRRDPSVTRVRFLLADTTRDGNFPKIGNFGVREYDIVARDAGRDDGPLLVWGPERVSGLNGRNVFFSRGSRNDDSIEHLRLRVPAGQSTTATDQQERLEVRYECFSGGDRIGNEREQHDNRVRLVMNTQKFFGAYIGSEGRSRGEIDLGDLSPTSGLVSREAIVTAVTTVPYDVSVGASQTGELTSRDSDDGLPYRLTFDNFQVKDGSRLRCGSAEAPNGDAHRIQVTVDGADTRPLRAGRYRDTVVLTFSPRDTVQTGACRLIDR